MRDLHVSSVLPQDEITLGDSIAVNGVCLTVVEKSAGVFPSMFLRRRWREHFSRVCRPGSFVNLERALRLGDRLGGHLVSGHVDCIAVIRERREVSGNYLFSFQLPVSYCTLSHREGFRGYRRYQSHRQYRFR